MAAHPVGGASFSGDVSLLGDLTAQNVTASGTINTANLASTASYISLTPGVTPSPVEGMIFANAANHHLYYYNATAWVQLDN